MVESPASISCNNRWYKHKENHPLYEAIISTGLWPPAELNAVGRRRRLPPQTLVPPAGDEAKSLVRDVMAYYNVCLNRAGRSSRSTRGKRVK
jgi:hypothetical protein